MKNCSLFIKKFFENCWWGNAYRSMVGECIQEYLTSLNPPLAINDENHQKSLAYRYFSHFFESASLNPTSLNPPLAINDENHQKSLAYRYFSHFFESASLNPTSLNPPLAINDENYQQSLAYRYFSHLAPSILFFFTKRQSQKGKGAWHNVPFKTDGS